MAYEGGLAKGRLKKGVAGPCHRPVPKEMEWYTRKSIKQIRQKGSIYGRLKGSHDSPSKQKIKAAIHFGVRFL